MKPRLSLFLAVPLTLCLMGADAHRPYTRSRFVRAEEGPMPNAYAQVELIEMGGCQYVLVLARGRDESVSIVHHAACTNPAHTVKPSAP